MAEGVCCGKLLDRCSQVSDRARESTWGLRVAMLLIHGMFVGTLFLVDDDLRAKIKTEPWYTGTYFAFLLVTLVQYLYTSSSSPGYVIDAMREGNGKFLCSSSQTLFKQSVSRNGDLLLSLDPDQLRIQNSQMNPSLWLRVVMDLYPPGSASRNWTCTHCNIIQPPRSKHCHDCDKCVLQFDHHCLWLGTCIGQGNHCRFWWYILEETILCAWTVALYIMFLRSSDDAWWKDLIMIILLATLIFCLIFLALLLFFHSYLVLTNQTTYELVRRKRILYLRNIPERVHPFSKGICRNLYSFCCSRNTTYKLEEVPRVEEIQARARPYTCVDIFTCRCC